MPRYYFDMRENGALAVDREGLVLPSLQAVRMEAVRSLVDIAKEAIWATADSVLGHRMVMEVRDANGPVLQAKFSFELERHEQ